MYALEDAAQRRCRPHTQSIHVQANRRRRLVRVAHTNRPGASPPALPSQPALARSLEFDAVINCLGMGAATLVQHDEPPDACLQPVRGQTVKVMATPGASSACVLYAFCACSCFPVSACLSACPSSVEVARYSPSCYSLSWLCSVWCTHPLCPASLRAKVKAPAVRRFVVDLFDEDALSYVLPRLSDPEGTVVLGGTHEELSRDTPEAAYASVDPAIGRTIRSRCEALAPALREVPSEDDVHWASEA